MGRGRKKGGGARKVVGITIGRLLCRLSLRVLFLSSVIKISVLHSFLFFFFSFFFFFQIQNRSTNSRCWLNMIHHSWCRVHDSLIIGFCSFIYFLNLKAGEGIIMCSTLQLRSIRILPFFCTLFSILLSSHFSQFFSQLFLFYRVEKSMPPFSIFQIEHRTTLILMENDD